MGETKELIEKELVNQKLFLIYGRDYNRLIEDFMRFLYKETTERYQLEKELFNSDCDSIFNAFIGIVDSAYKKLEEELKKRMDFINKVVAVKNSGSG